MFAAMKGFLREFKAFAAGGNMMDLALGFIIGAAFAALVESLASNVIMGFIASVFGKTDFTSEWRWKSLAYGQFIADVIGFAILALVLFMLVKAMKRAKLGSFRAQGQRECDFCKEFIAVDATRCKWCTSEVVAAFEDE